MIYFSNMCYDMYYYLVKFQLKTPLVHGVMKNIQIVLWKKYNLKIQSVYAASFNDSGQQTKTSENSVGSGVYKYWHSLQDHIDTVVAGRSE